MGAWLTWLVLAVLLGAAEIFTLTVALGLLGAAALITAGAAAVGVPLAGQLLVFAITGMAGLILVRPIAVRHMSPPLQAFGTDALAGRSAQVLQEVTAVRGVVRIDGEDWSARVLDNATVISPGATVDVLYVDGATAVVYPRE